MTIVDSTRQADRVPDLSDYPIPPKLRRLLETNRCSCSSFFRAIFCDWLYATHNYAIGCEECRELVAEGNTFDELAVDFEQHVDFLFALPF